MITLDLRKQMVLDLKKTKGLKGQTAKVAFVLDYSGSMDGLYRSGKCQELLERIFPVALSFDNDQALDMYIFHDNVIKVSPDVTRNTFKCYIESFILRKYSFGGTHYAPAIRRIVEDYTGHRTNIKERVVAATGGLFGKLFGKKKEMVAEVVQGKPLTEPVFVIFITDGDNFDHDEARQAMIDASRYGIFFQFVGIGYSNFNFLEELDTMQGRAIDNASFFHANDIASMSDEGLYNHLMEEFPQWMIAARIKNILVRPTES